MSRPITESKYFRAMNVYLFVGAVLLAWIPTLPLCTNGAIQIAAAQDDPIEPPPAETPRNPSAKPATQEPAPSEPDPSATPTSQDDLLNSTPSQPATPPSLAGGADPVQALTEARAAMAASQWRTAIDSWTTVLNANPTSEEAKNGLQKAQMQLDQDSGSLLDKVGDEMTVRRESLRVNFENSYFSANEKLNRGDYAGANMDASTAKQLLDRDQSIIPVSEFDAMNTRVGALIDQINESRIVGQALDQSKQRADAQKSSSDAQRMAQQKRLATISEMLMRVRQLQMELKYDEALQVIDQILFMDPTNPAALALRDVLESTKMYRQWSDAQRQRNAAFGQMQLQDMQATIPPKINLSGVGPKSTNAMMTYPEDWPRLSLDNEKFAPAGWARTPEDASIAKLFDEQFPFPETTSNQKLSEILAFWQQITKIPMYVNWKALGEIDITQETEGILLEKATVSARVMLGRILEQVGNPTSDSGRAVSEIMNGQVAITTFTALQALVPV